MRLFLPRCIKLITKISYYVGWPSFYEGPGDLNSSTLVFMERNYPVSHLPSPLPSLCPTLLSLLHRSEKKVKDYMGKMNPEIPRRVLLGQQWSHSEMITSSGGHCVLTCRVAIAQLFFRLGDPRTLASTSALFPGRSLLVPRCLNSCTGGWLLLDGFLQWQARLRSSWHKGVTKRT